MKPKTTKEMQAELARLKADERIAYPSADVQINVVLALVQVEIGAKIHTLEWALGLPLSIFPIKQPRRKKK